jgi:hypothetical protein
LAQPALSVGAQASTGQSISSTSIRGDVCGGCLAFVKSHVPVESCQHNTKLRHTGQRVSVTSPCVAVAMATPAPSTATLSSVESLLTDAVRHEDDVSEYAATHPHTHMTIVSICTHTATPFHPTVDFHATNLSHTARTLSTHVPEAMNSFMMPSLMSLRRRPGCLTHAHLLCLEFKRTLTYTHIELRQTQQANN